MATASVQGNKIKKCKYQATDVVTWDTKKVEAFLAKNNISGCGEILARHRVDGRAFLNLDLRALTEWTGLSIIQRSKIVALLNELGPESYRKQIAASSSSSTRRPSNNFFAGAAAVSAPRQSFPAAKNNAYTFIKPLPKPLPAKRFLPKAPPPPPKPEHLKQSYYLNNNSVQPVKVGSDQLNSPSTNSELRDVSKVESFLHQQESSRLLETVVDNESLNAKGPTDDEEVVAYCSDSFSSDFSSDDENDENVNDSLLHNKVHNKKKCHKNKLSFAKLFHLDQQKKIASGDHPLGTPPLPPSRTNRSQHSSQSSLAGSDTALSQQIPLTSMLTLTPSQSTSSNILPPTNPPPPVPRNPSQNASSSLLSLPSSLHAASQQSLTFRDLPSPSAGALVGNKRGSTTSSTDSEVGIQPWYFNADRKQAEPCLMKYSDGTFLIRPSKHGGTDTPFTLSLRYNKRIFHIQIRKRMDDRYALGSQKAGEDSFLSLAALVQHHQKEPMHLHASNTFAGTTRLTRWPENLL